MSRNKFSLKLSILAALALLMSHSPVHSAEVVTVTDSNSEARQVSEVKFWATDSSSFWRTYLDIQKSSNITESISAEILKKPQTREGILTFNYIQTSHRPWMLKNFFASAYLDVKADSLSGGYFRNKVLPELTGYSTQSIQFKFGLSTLSHSKPSDWQLDIASLVGVGQQEIVSGTAIEAITNSKTQSSMIFYTGLDLALGYNSDFSDYIYVDNQLKTKLTYFSAEKLNSAKKNVSPGDFRIRWKNISETGVRFSNKNSGGFLIAAQSILGQQPTPMHLLPRTWDSIHKIKVLPSVGTLIGLGGVAKLYSKDRSYHLEALGGYYGGYFGYGINLKLSFLKLSAGSFGLEQTQDFQNFENRQKYIQAALDYVW